MRWHLSYRASPSAAAVADRHYSRQKKGAKQFVKPGRCVVLSADGPALWVSSWPYAEHVRHAWAGAWECSLFRSEGVEDLASALIREAVAATRAVWGDPPLLGFITFIDPTKVRPVVVRGLPTFGYSWRKAGWHYDGTTAGGLLAFALAPAEMPPASPPLGYAVPLFGTDAARKAGSR